MHFHKFSTFVAAVVSLVAGASAQAMTAEDTSALTAQIGYDLTWYNRYGAPYPPWFWGAKPGWYHGSNPGAHPNLPCFPGPTCSALKGYPYPWVLQCPPPPKPAPTPTPPKPTCDPYHQTFSNLTGATQAGDYQTYGLVDTVAQCKAMCNTVAGCHFVNTYHDVHGKNGSPQLTCSLFTSCHTSADADNHGGQSQPDGTINFITNSDGWCKD